MARETRAGLGFWDRLVLFVAWLVTCGLVYLFGFYVGKGTNERGLAFEDRAVSLPVTSKPPLAGQRPKAESEFTFYETLGAGEGPGGRENPAARSGAQVPSPEPGPARPAPAAPPAGAAIPAGAAPPAATPRPAASPPPAAAAAPRPAPPPALPPATAPPPAVTPTAPATPPAVAPVPARPAGGGWTVLANPTRDRAEAESLQRQLRERGYDATLVRIARDGETWYRLQIGRFATAEQANQTMRKLREREGVTHVFVASDSE